jgi:hypothetical protein
MVPVFAPVLVVTKVAFTPVVVVPAPKLSGELVLEVASPAATTVAVVVSVPSLFSVTFADCTLFFITRPKLCVAEVV